MAVLYIFTGRPFAGKTTAARKLSRAVGAMYIGIDDLGAEQSIGLLGEHVHQATYDNLHRIAAERAEIHLRNYKTVIYDATVYRQQRMSLVRLAARCGAQHLTIFVDTPRAVTYQRWLNNQVTRERPLQHPKQFQDVTDSFEPPCDSEPHVVLHSDNERTRWLDAASLVQRQQLDLSGSADQCKLNVA